MVQVFIIGWWRVSVIGRRLAFPNPRTSSLALNINTTFTFVCALPVAKLATGR